MKKLLFLLFLIPNLVLAELISVESVPKISSLEIKNFPLKNSLTNKAFDTLLESKALKSFNLKKGWEACDNADVDIHGNFSLGAFQTELGTVTEEVIPTNKEIKFILTEKPEENVLIDFHERRPYEDFLVKIKISKNYKLYSGPVYAVINKYLKESTIPIIGDLGIFDSTCNALARYYLNPSEGNMIGKTGWVPTKNKTLAISLFVSFEGTWKYLTDHSVDENGFTSESSFDKGLSFVKLYPFADKDEETKIKVVCNSCLDKPSKEYLIDLTSEKKQYDIDIIEDEKRRKVQAIEDEKRRKAQAIEDEKRRKAQAIEDEKRKELYDKKMANVKKLVVQVAKLIKEINPNHVSKTSSKNADIEDQLFSLCYKMWSKNNSKLKLASYQVFMDGCMGSYAAGTFDVPDLGDKAITNLEQSLKSSVSELQNRKEAMIQAKKRAMNAKKELKKREMDAKKELKKREMERKVKKINKLKDECESIGFKKGTTKFKNCVLELM